MTFSRSTRAGRAVELLKEKISTLATVVRDGARQDIHLADLVPGDIITLAAGDIVPADARVIQARDFFVDESALTGESFPVEKTAQARAGGDHDSRQGQSLFMSSPVVSGSATAVVVKTGMATDYGKIAERLTARPPGDGI